MFTICSRIVLLELSFKYLSCRLLTLLAKPRKRFVYASINKVIAGNNKAGVLRVNSIQLYLKKLKSHQLKIAINTYFF
jgi:hypothetical protein